MATAEMTSSDPAFKLLLEVHERAHEKERKENPTLPEFDTDAAAVQIRDLLERAEVAYPDFERNDYVSGNYYNLPHTD